MKHGFVKVGVAVPELRVADCTFNADKIIELAKKAAEQGVLALAFPELSITGSTCGDLFFRETLIKSAEASLARIAAETSELDTLIAVGLPIRVFGKLYNCAAVLHKGEILGIVSKRDLGAQNRWFEQFPVDYCFCATFAGQENTFFSGRKIFEHDSLNELKIAVELGEDAFAVCPPSADHVRAGATVILNLAAMPESIGQPELRKDTIRMLSERYHCAYAFANAGCGESTTDLVYSGHSFVFENGTQRAGIAPFDENMNLAMTEIDVKKLTYIRLQNKTFVCEYDENYSYPSFDTPMIDTKLLHGFRPRPFVPSTLTEQNRRTVLTLKMQSVALAKRIEHTHSKSLVIGISGGLDSTLAILVCVDAMKRLGRPLTDIYAVTLPCFGTGKRTRTNAEVLCERLGVSFECIDIAASVSQHLKDIGHDENTYDVTFENAQARERTQVLMDLANARGGLVVGTGDLSEVALGWSTYNGDHMSMYGVNCDVPKTFIRCMIKCYAENLEDRELAAVLTDILDTPISPELVPTKDGELGQKTESLIGDYDLHDFFLYHFLHDGYEPDKLYRVACLAFDGIFAHEHIKKTLRTFVWRFFTQQFKRSCCPDGVKIGSVALSPRGAWQMPSDAVCDEWLKIVDSIDAD